MIIYVDTREHPKVIAPIVDHFKAQGLTVVFKKLDVGDYAIEGNNRVVVDRKRSFNEVVQNLGGDQMRLDRECQRAVKNGVKLVFLIEQTAWVKHLEDVANWKNPNPSKSTLCMSGRELMERMHRLSVMYGVEWHFCARKDIGRKILEILTRNLLI